MMKVTEVITPHDLTNLPLLNLILGPEALQSYDQIIPKPECFESAKSQACQKQADYLTPQPVTWIPEVFKSKEITRLKGAIWSVFF